MNTQPSAADFIKAAAYTAECFGFLPLDTIKNTPDCINCEKKIAYKASAQDRKTDALHGILTSGMCAYFDNKMQGLGGPALFYTLEQVPRSGDIALSLQVFNVRKSIAESLLIQTTRSLLSDLGYEHYCVRVNSLGDQDSITRYIRELSSFMRKRINDLPPPARELMKEHVFNALTYLIEKQHELADRSPNPMEYLSDLSRKHFRDLVEYLDMSNTPYEIDPKLIGHQDCYSDALFAFDVYNNETQEPNDSFFIRGGRYNTFISRMSKNDVPAAGAVIVLRGKKAPAHIPQPRSRHTTPIFLVQLGFAPKMKSLLLIDELRRAGIPVHQDIVSDSLGDQLRKAEARKSRYAVIMGQKEYVAGTVIIRDLQMQSQEYVPLSSLAAHLRRVS